MQIDFYTTRISPYCRAVKMLATHLNIPLNEIYVRPFTDSRSEAFKKINPCHILPTINDNGFILWESRAIMQYLCNKYAPNSTLYPKDPQLRATVERLLNFDLKSLSYAILSAHFEFTFPNEFSASRGEKMVELTDSLTLLEIFLINKDYVAGDCLTIADISLIANVTLLEIAVEFDLSSYPNIWGWFNRLRRELPYYDELTKIANDEHRQHIKSIRDEYEEWSPSHFCVFMPCEKHNGLQPNQVQTNGTNELQTNAMETRDSQPNGFKINSLHTNDMETNDLQPNRSETNGYQQNGCQTNSLQLNDLQITDLDLNDLYQNHLYSNGFQLNHLESNYLHSNGLEPNSYQTIGSKLNGLQPNGY